MPLVQGKSPEAFKSNLKAEMAAGKPMKQSLAIAYAVKRKNKKALGGQVEAEERDAMDYEPEALEGEIPDSGMAKGGEMNEKLHPMAKYAHGGMDPKHIAHVIVMKKANGGMAGYAKGGEVSDISSADHLKEAADYELGHEASDMKDDSYSIPDGDGSMPYGEEALYEDGNSSMEQMRDHLPSDAEHEIEGMDGMRQAMARKGMLSRIMGNLRARHMKG